MAFKLISLFSSMTGFSSISASVQQIILKCGHLEREQSKYLGKEHIEVINIQIDFFAFPNIHQLKYFKYPLVFLSTSYLIIFATSERIITFLTHAQVKLILKTLILLTKIVTDFYIECNSKGQC